MTVKYLTTDQRRAITVQEGESCDVVAVPADMNGDAITKANLATLTATLFDEATGAVINGRNAQSVMDAHGGAVATDGTLTLRLQPLDSVIVGSVEVGETETHILRLEWTWSDGTATRTGRREWGIKVQKVQEVS